MNKAKKSHALLLIMLCFSTAAAVAQRYAVTDLGPLAPTGINSWAQVVGNYNGHAFLWARGQGMRDLGRLAGGSFSSAAAINDLGVVAGTADGPGTVVSPPSSGDPSQRCSDLTQPFVWTLRNGMVGLGTVPFAFGSWAEFWCITPFYALAVNLPGRVVGFSGNPGSSYQWSFLWNQSVGMEKFGGSWPPSYSSGINNLGQIVGQDTDFTISIVGRAATWKNGIITYLTPLDASDPDVLGISSGAIGINDRGQIVGWSSTSPWSSDFHAVSWENTGLIRDLGTLPGDSLSVASKINFFGQVIGSSGNLVSSQYMGDGGPLGVAGRPFIWTERAGMRDLNTLIHPNSGWVLTSASDINAWGQIVGSGIRNGQQHGYLLTPMNPFQLF